MPRFSVVIPTYNRRRHLPRAIESVLQQTWPAAEIIVVDDASPDDTREFLESAYPQVRYLRQAVNQGPGPARQRGILEARNPWVVMLDDDDALHSEGLQTIADTIRAWPEAHSYPALLFAHGNAAMGIPFQVLHFPEYLGGTFSGDMLPVFQRERYLAAGLSYPSTRLGGECLLFWRAALEFGIPTWSKCVGTVGADAALRLTSVGQQIRRAPEHAELQELTLRQFAATLQQHCPRELARRHLAAATYWLLSGKRRSAFRHLPALARQKRFVQVLGILLAALLPAALLRWMFLNYRRVTAPHTYRPSAAAGPSQSLSP